MQKTEVTRITTCLQEHANELGSSCEEEKILYEAGIIWECCQRHTRRSLCIPRHTHTGWTMREAQAEEVWAWRTAAHTVSADGLFCCWTLPSGWFWLVHWLSGCCPAPSRHSCCSTPGGLPADCVGWHFILASKCASPSLFSRSGHLWLDYFVVQKFIKMDNLVCEMWCKWPLAVLIVAWARQFSDKTTTFLIWGIFKIISRGKKGKL